MRLVSLFFLGSLFLSTFAFAESGQEAESAPSFQVQDKAPANVEPLSMASSGSLLSSAKKAVIIGVVVYLIISTDDLWAWLDDGWLDPDQ